jgi:hypothetical protein
MSGGFHLLRFSLRPINKPVRQNLRLPNKKGDRQRQNNKITQELTAPASSKGSKAPSSSGEVSSPVGSVGLEAPESSTSSLFLLRLGEVARGGEREWLDSEGWSDPESFSDEATDF